MRSWRTLTAETPRLTLRHVQQADAGADYFALLSDEWGCLMDGYEPLTTMDEQFFARIAAICRDEGRYAVLHRASGRVIGEVGLRPTEERAVSCAYIDYKIHPAFRQQGYGMEAVSACLDAAFGEQGLEMIVAAVLPENRPSQRLLGKLGFVREGLRRCSSEHGRFGPVDEVIFSIQREEWGNGIKEVLSHGRYL